MREPNIFHYATSELSQDAFICWLLSWGDKSYIDVNKNLNKLSVDFVRNLIGNENLDVNKVQVWKQWKHIDILALVNDRYCIVIEDKKATKDRSGQLDHYAEIVRSHFKDESIEIKLVYFKMQEQGNYSEVEKAGFSPFKRDKMLPILKNYIDSTEKVEQSDIVADYFNYLQNLDKEIKSYLTMPLDKWIGWHAWQGFYTELQKHVGGGWDYVPNPSGGFLGFWWHWKVANIEGRQFEFNLLLEFDKLVFKVYAYEENERKEVRRLYRDVLFKKAKELNIEISKYGKLGKYMAAARLNHEYRAVDEEGVLNLEGTLKNLKQVMNLLDELEKEIG